VPKLNTELYRQLVPLPLLVAFGGAEVIGERSHASSNMKTKHLFLDSRVVKIEFHSGSAARIRTLSFRLCSLISFYFDFPSSLYGSHPSFRRIFFYVSPRFIFYQFVLSQRQFIRLSTYNISLKAWR
jgi:hypothetical protein